MDAMESPPDALWYACRVPCEPLVPPDTTALRALAEAAPKGPYVVYCGEGPVWLPDGRKVGPDSTAAGWQLSICYPGTGPRDEGHRCIATALLARENDPEGGAIAALFAASRTAIVDLCDEVDALREKVARANRERDDARNQLDAMVDAMVDASDNDWGRR